LHDLRSGDGVWRTAHAAGDGNARAQGKEVLLKVTQCGVCHSDVHLHDGYFDMGGGVKAPVRAPLR